MTGYLIHFSIYTLAMIGIIFGALYVFKLCAKASFAKKSQMLNIEDSMSLSARKKLHVINVDGERFLIAADMDRTSLISKLGEKSEMAGKEIPSTSTPTREDKSTTLKSFDGIDSLSEFASIIDFNKKSSNTNKKQPMMRELARKLNAI